MRFFNRSDRVYPNGLQPNANLALANLTHYRYALALKCPTLCRHVMIFTPYRSRLPKDKSGHFPGEFKLRTVRNQLKTMIISIVSRYNLDFDSGSFENELKEFRSSTIAVGICNGFHMRIKVDLHSEYCTVTFFLDATVDIKQDDPDMIAEHWRPWIEVSGSRQVAPNRDSADVIYDQFWGAFDHYHGIEYRLEPSARMFGPIEGSVIGDFRGLIVRTSDLDPREQHHRFIQSCLGFDATWHSLNSNERNKRTLQNVIFCKLPDYHTLYGNDLGNPRVGRPTPQGLPIPVRYFFVYEGDNEHEIGLAVHRSHTMGELRVASLIDRETVTQLSDHMRQLGDDITNTIHSAALGKISRRRFENILTRYNDLASFCHGGLVYRVGQSNRYYAALRNRATDTKIVRLDGFPTYTQFLERNHERIMHSTASVGYRFRAMGERVDRFITLYQAERMRRVYKAALTIPFMLLIYTATNWTQNNPTVATLLDTQNEVVYGINRGVMFVFIMGLLSLVYFVATLTWGSLRTILKRKAHAGASFKMDEE
jgi:hypothetical protein